jgi:hypothetical protein
VYYDSPKVRGVEFGRLGCLESEVGIRSLEVELGIGKPKVELGNWAARFGSGKLVNLIWK